MNTKIKVQVENISTPTAQVTTRLKQIDALSTILLNITQVKLFQSLI